VNEKPAASCWVGGRGENRNERPSGGAVRGKEIRWTRAFPAPERRRWYGGDTAVKMIDRTYLFTFVCPCCIRQYLSCPCQISFDVGYTEKDSSFKPRDPGTYDEKFFPIHRYSPRKTIVPWRDKGKSHPRRSMSKFKDRATASSLHLSRVRDHPVTTLPPPLWPPRPQSKESRN
jgi:hypothetical protein